MEYLTKVLKSSFKNFTTFMKFNTQKTIPPLKNYFAVGFDVDHTLIRYQAKEIFPILCDSLYKVLIEDKGYPSNMVDFGPFERNFFMNGLVIDLKTGNILKLGEEKLVLRAYFGYNMLTNDQIESIYGIPPVFETFNPINPFTEEYFCCLSFFECYFPLVFAKMVEFKRKGRNYLEQKEVKEILDDGFYAVGVNYSNCNEEIYHPILEFGHYYKSVLQNMKKVLHEQTNMLNALKTLKEKEKVLFLVSDSHYEYVGALMDHVYGKEWLSIFDFALLHAKKPEFFHAIGKPFREIDLTKVNKKGPQVEKLQRNQMYILGNASLLEQNMRELKGKNTHGDRILYIGDHYSLDILAAKDCENWDTVCVMEELGELDLGDDYDGRVWGNWQYEETAKGIIPTFWYSEMMKKADKCVPTVDSEEMMEFYYQEEVSKKERLTPFPGVEIQP